MPVRDKGADATEAWIRRRQHSTLLCTEHSPGVLPVPEVQYSLQCAFVSARHSFLLCKCRLSFSLKRGIINGCPLRLLWNKNCLCSVHWTLFYQCSVFALHRENYSHWFPEKEEVSIKHGRLEIPGIFLSEKIQGWNLLTLLYPRQSNQR